MRAVDVELTNHLVTSAIRAAGREANRHNGVTHDETRLARHGSVALQTVVLSRRQRWAEIPQKTPAAL